MQAAQYQPCEKTNPHLRASISLPGVSRHLRIWTACCRTTPRASSSRRPWSSWVGGFVAIATSGLVYDQWEAVVSMGRGIEEKTDLCAAVRRERTALVDHQGKLLYWFCGMEVRSTQCRVAVWLIWSLVRRFLLGWRNPRSVGGRRHHQIGKCGQTRYYHTTLYVHKDYSVSISSLSTCTPYGVPCIISLLISDGEATSWGSLSIL